MKAISDMPIVLQFDGVTVEIHSQPGTKHKASVEVICVTKEIRLVLNGREVEFSE